MDTKFWGPSGWRLLHLITFMYEPEAQRSSVREMFTMLPFVLPCKFCRASLTDYMKKEPLTETVLKDSSSLSRWLYKIHNLVNAKLRGQGLLNEADPSFEAVERIYQERIRQGCTRTTFEGWDFLFSIAENHPFSRSGRNSLPMPDAPASAGSPLERNKWNLMKSGERMKFYEKFWKSLGKSLPFEEWRGAWDSCDVRWGRMRAGRRAWIREIWRLRCCMEKKLELVNKEEFESLCRKLQDHRSGCGRKRRAITCRRLRGGERKTLKNKRV
jgi:hypothetical protein